VSDTLEASRRLSGTESISEYAGMLDCLSDGDNSLFRRLDAALFLLAAEELSAVRLDATSGFRESLVRIRVGHEYSLIVPVGHYPDGADARTRRWRVVFRVRAKVTWTSRTPHCCNSARRAQS
jgi:hypothetical protein